jgi:hypothetical protein
MNHHVAACLFVLFVMFCALLAPWIAIAAGHIFDLYFAYASWVYHWAP